MLGVSVSLYYLRVTERRKQEPLVLSNFDGKTDLLDVVHNALKEYQDNSVEIKGGTRRTYITNDLTRKDRIIEGSVEVGNSGYTVRGADGQPGKRQQDRRSSRRIIFSVCSPPIEYPGFPSQLSVPIVERRARRRSGA